MVIWHYVYWNNPSICLELTNDVYMPCYPAAQSTWLGLSLDPRNENGETEEKQVQIRGLSNQS
jgi:hypothetical protein